MKTNILKRGKKYHLWDFLIISFKVSPLCMLGKLTIQIINSLVPSIQILVTARFIDTALAIFNGTMERNNIYLPLIWIMLITVYNYVNWWFANLVGTKLSMKLTEIIYAEVIEKRARLEYKHIEDNDTWDLIKRTCRNTVNSINSVISNILGAMNIILRVLSLLIILVTQVWWVAIVVIGISVPLFFLAIKGGKATYKANKDAEKHNRKADYLHNVLSSRDNVEERALFGYTDELNQKWHDKYEEARKINLKVDLRYFIQTKGSSLITIVIAVFIIAVLLIPLSDGTITSGMFVGLVTATLSLIQMMSWNLSWVTRQLANNQEYIKDFTILMGLSEQEGALDLPIQDSEVSFDSIEFEDVSFKYPGTDRYILNHFNLKLDKNLHYAFVGVNGAGKTTITKLLTGMYDNYEGEIRINGKSLREYKLSELKALFSVVYQDFARYQISIEDNIYLGDVNRKDEDRLNEALNQLDLKETISKLPNGKKTYLGKIKEGGVDLSGGEWQRVAIARALYSPSKISILDEPTASLDPVAESNIYKMFAKISQGQSTIFITHRLGAAKLADEVIVIDDGSVVEQGSHEILMKNDGIYAKMFESQRSWYQCGA